MINVTHMLKRRISNVNRVKIADIVLTYQHLDDKGHGSFGYFVDGHKHGPCQVHISEKLGQALLHGNRNKNLDNRLRL